MLEGRLERGGQTEKGTAKMARLLTAKRKQRKSDISENVLKHSVFYRKHEFIIRWPFHDKRI